MTDYRLKLLDALTAMLAYEHLDDHRAAWCYLEGYLTWGSERDLELAEAFARVDRVLSEKRSRTSKSLAELAAQKPDHAP